MAYLEWLNRNGAVLSGNSAVQTGKEVWLRGRECSALPSHFTVYRRFGFLLSAYLRRKGRRTVRQVGQPQTVVATDMATAFAGPWVLPTPGRRIKWRLFFVDDALNASEELHDTRLGTFSAKAGAAAEGVGLDVEGDFKAAIDPVLRLSVLTPWQDDGFEDYLFELAADVANEDELVPESFASLSEFLSPLRSNEPPDGWSFYVEETEFELEEGERAPLRVRFEMPTPGTVVFALQMSAVLEDGEVSVASEPMVAHMPEEGSQGAVLLGGGDAGGGGARSRTTAGAAYEPSPHTLEEVERLFSRRPSPGG